MILVDSSIWADHLRSGDGTLAALLDAEEVLCHPFVVGEILMGNARNWSGLREILGSLPQAIVAEHKEVLDMVERYRLYGIGIGYVDVHLLASTQLAGNVRLWTRDRRLAKAAEALGLFAAGVPKLQ